MPKPVACAPTSAVDSLAYREHREGSEGQPRSTQDLGYLSTIGRQESATTTLSMVPAGAVYTGGHSLKKGPKTAHFFSLFGPRGVIPTCRDSVRKPFHARQIGDDSWASRATKIRRGTDPQNSHIDFPLLFTKTSVSRTSAADAFSLGLYCAKRSTSMTRLLWMPRAIASVPSCASTWKVTTGPLTWITRALHVTVNPSGAGARCSTSTAVPTLRS